MVQHGCGAVNEERILEALSLVSEVETEILGDPRLCHSTAFALRNVLGYFGQDSKVVPVDVLVVRKDPSIPGGGYMSTCGNPKHPFGDAPCNIAPKPLPLGMPGTDFHSVVFTNAKGKDLMLDPTSGQFARPQYGVDIPLFFCAEMSEETLAASGDGLGVAEEDGGGVTVFRYSLSAVRDKDPYRLLNTGNGSLVRQIAGAVIRRMRRGHG
jgi:hypothetical protein